MPHTLADRVKETTITEGTGAFALGGAVNGYLAFSSRLSVGNTTWYAAVLGTQWEVGLGTLTAASTLARTAVLASSNGDALVSFAAGTKEVFLDFPAALAARLSDFGLPETTVASAATVDLGAQNSRKIAVSGTATVTSFGTVANGEKLVRFTAAGCTLTHNATTLALPTRANITTAAGDTAVVTSDGSGNWTVRSYERADGTPVAYSSTGVARAISGLVPYNDTTTPLTTLGIGAGTARDKDNNVDIVLAASITKRLDAVWAAGSGNGGLDSGTRANFTPYHVFAIRNPTSGVVDVLFSTSPTAPTMPSGYTQRRRIGVLQTDGSSNIYPGLWRADGSFEFATPINLTPSGQALTANALFLVLNNAGIKRRWVGYVAATGSANYGVVIRDPDVGALAAGTAAPSSLTVLFHFGGVTSGLRMEAWTDTAGRVYLGTDTFGSGNVVYLQTLGWVDLRDEYA